MHPKHETWGKYRIRRLIGVGGMAEIFEADMLGPAGFVKPVCLKCVRPTLSADPRFVQMFQGEARIAALLHHTNIVSVFDFDQHEGRLFLAMEYIDGLDLRQLLGAAAEVGLLLPPPFAVHVLDSLLAALAHAHDRMVDGVPRPVIHRDVSPQNVLISTDGVVKLTDFGIAKATGVSDVTQQGIIKGKLAYLSPEQASGKPVDQTSDLFSAGLVFYEMLTGTRFFQGLDQRNLLARLHSFKPQPIPWASSALNDLLSHLVVANRTERFQSAEATRNALRNVGIAPLGTRDTAKLVTDIRAMRERTEAKAGERTQTAATPEARVGHWERTHRSTIPPLAFFKRRGKLITALTLLTTILVGLLIMGVNRWREKDDDVTPSAAKPDTGPAPPPTVAVRVRADKKPPAEPPLLEPAAEKDQSPSETPPKPVAQRPRAPTTQSVKKRTAESPPAAHTGTLAVNVRPWASVSVDGIDRGTTPLKGLALTAGNHQVTLVNQQLGYSETMGIRIQPDAVETINKVIKK